MSLFMHSSQEETFQTLMDYFTRRRYKILISNSPSLLRAEIGSYYALTISSGTAKGEVEAMITKTNDGSHLNLNFDFTKEYMLGLVTSILLALVVFVIDYFIVVAHAPSYLIGDAWAIFFAATIPVAVPALVSINLLERYYVSKTRKKFVDEFNTFVQSLTQKKT